MIDVRRAALAALLAGCGLLAAACGGAGSKTPPKADAKAEKEKVDAQAARKAAVEGLVERGAFAKVRRESGADLAEVWVTPQFLALPEKDQLAAVLIAVNYLFDLPKDGKLEPTQRVNLLDQRGKRKLGYFSTDTGLVID